MASELMIDLGYALRASKRIEYKDRLRKQCRTFILFIQNKGLLINPIINNGEFLSDNFKLLESELTKTGVYFFDKVYLKWAKKIDKGGDPEDITYLENEFDKLAR